MDEWDEDFDFISLGAGMGGLAGAIAAHEFGARSAIIEKSHLIGGVTAQSQGQLWVPGNHVASAAGIVDDWQSGLSYMLWAGGGYADEALARAHCENAAPVVRFFEEKAGLHWKLMAGYPDYYWPVANGSLGEGRYLEVEPFDGSSLGEMQKASRTSIHPSMTNSEVYADGIDTGIMAERLARDERTMGAGMLGYFAKAALDRDVPVYTATNTIRLITSNGRVVGVEIEKDGSRRKLRAHKAVLLATGGYDWNAELTKLYDAVPGQGSWVMPAVTGDHLRLAGMIGAKLASPAYRPQWVSLGFRIPGDVDAEGIPNWQSISFKNPHAILVNRHGKRFCDESFAPSYVAALSQIDVSAPTLANHPFWAIFDAQYARKYQLSGSRALTHMEAGAAADPGDLPWIVSSQTLRELGNATGIHPDGLEEQVAFFNAHAVEGKDPQFGRGTRPQAVINGDHKAPFPNLGPLNEAPFYAVKLETSTMGIPTSGLAANTVGNVLDWENQPIPGLYCAGNSMALLDLGVSYNSGNAATRGMVFAYLAAHHACRAPNT